ncbi:PadR family transcriptional regulator [Natronomonas sp. EA1]|uniref:PadR family transcriptional regulator n=1 Tax=Natronomonas sp. EA1 TaxID=3421655 RepID=UPI003EC1157A
MYHASALRRDICALLSERELRGQQLKRTLEGHYDQRVKHDTFYRALEELEELGHVESRTEGIHDVYALTSGGERALREHVAWLNEQVEKE